MPKFGLCSAFIGAVGGRSLSRREAMAMQAGFYSLDALISFLVCQLAEILEMAKAILEPQPEKRGKRNRGSGSGAGEARALKAAVYRKAQATHSGDGKNIQNGGPSGIRGHVWYAWVGDPKMSTKGIGGRYEPVNCALIDLPSGKYGSQTTGDAEWMAVNREFRADPANQAKRRASLAAVAG